VKLIVGLGNPGERYQATRHNLGFLIIERIAARHGLRLERKVHEALVDSFKLDGATIVLAKPQAYVNRSGAVVVNLLQEFALTPADLIVINDDLDLPFGRIRIRPSGSAGGHRGLASVTESLAGAPFCRVRVGIGRPPEGKEAAQYVLESFSATELDQLGEVIDRAAESAMCLVRDGLERAMAEYNRAN
jgi:PTH1 family peptidyl-tRNA hydrolase